MTQEFLHCSIYDNLNFEGVYWIFFPNEKYYIGSSKDIYERFMSHKRDLVSGKHGNRHFLNIYRKYGWPENILIHPTLDYLVLEQELLDNHIDDENCINIARSVYKPAVRKFPVYEYNIDGIFVKEWDSLKEIVDYYKISKGNLSMCLSGQRRSVLSKRFSKEKFDVLPKYKFTGRRKLVNETVVCSYDENGTLVKIYKNVHQINEPFTKHAKEKGNANISNALRNPQTKAYGYYWRRILKGNIPKTINIIAKNERGFSVVEIDTLTGKITNKWSSCRKAAKDLDITGCSLAERIKKGYIKDDKMWKYEQ